MRRILAFAVLFGAAVAAQAVPGGDLEGKRTSEVCIEPIVSLGDLAAAEAERDATPPGGRRSTIKPPFDLTTTWARLEAAGYRDLRSLGRGGHGAVVEATWAGRPVAVKVPSTVLYGMFLGTEETFLKELGAYVRNLRSTGKLAAVAPSYFSEGTLSTLPASHGQGEMPILVMSRATESAEDASSALPLIRRMDGGPQPEAVGKALKHHLPRALEQMHGAGIVHRDLKPSNLLLSRDLRLTVIDFGIAARSGEPALKRASGTLAYMGPEQLGELKARPRMDVFSAKKLLLEVLVGDDLAGFYTEKLQTDPDPALQEDFPSARRWQRAPEDKLGRLAVVLTTNVPENGAELRELVDLADDNNVDDDAFYRRFGELLARRSARDIVDDLLASKTLISRFPTGLGLSDAVASAVREAAPTVLREYDVRRRQLLTYRQHSTAQDGNLYGYVAQLKAHFGLAP